MIGAVATMSSVQVQKGKYNTDNKSTAASRTCTATTTAAAAALTVVVVGNEASGSLDVSDSSS
jgi:hypothetical protein